LLDSAQNFLQIGSLYSPPHFKDVAT